MCAHLHERRSAQRGSGHELDTGRMPNAGRLAGEGRQFDVRVAMRASSHAAEPCSVGLRLPPPSFDVSARWRVLRVWVTHSSASPCRLPASMCNPQGSWCCCTALRVHALPPCRSALREVPRDRTFATREVKGVTTFTLPHERSAEILVYIEPAGGVEPRRRPPAHPHPRRFAPRSLSWRCSTQSLSVATALGTVSSYVTSTVLFAEERRRR